MKKLMKFTALALMIFWLMQQTGFNKIVENLWVKAQESGFVEKVIEGAKDLTSILEISEETVAE